MHQKQNPAGFYTKGEEIFNAVSHGAGSVLAIGGTGALVLWPIGGQCSSALYTGFHWWFYIP